jgi:UDP-glucose 4-epimerase
MKKILITGGNGYIARSLYNSLKNDYEISIITRKDFDLTSFEDTNKYFENKFFDVVIHTAISGGTRLKKETDLIIRENLLMYRNLLNHQNKFIKFISFGSGAELGNPTTPYGISKQMIADSMSGKSGFLNIRIFAVFDENELDTRFIKSNIKRYINHENMIIHGDKLMDFFYMKDLISLVNYFLQKEEWSISHIDCTYPESYKLSEIATMINKLDHHKVEIDVGNSLGIDYIGTYRDLPIVLVGLEQGIKNTYNIIKQNK